MAHDTEKRQLLLILLIVFTGFLGSSVAYPLFPPLFLNPTDFPIVPAEWGSNARSIFLGIALAAYPLGLFIGSPIFGGCSDRYGRKRMLVLSLIGSTLGYFFTAMALEFNLLGTLLLSRFLTGLMEGNFSTVMAMATDLHGISKYKSLGRINAVSAIGYVMGPIIGGFFSDKTIVPWFSYALPFYIAMLFSALAVILAIAKLNDNAQVMSDATITIWQRFNLLTRIKYLFQGNVTLKNLLIISTVFTVAVDIFYEFGPVYLTGLWTMTPASIAIYNTALSVTLAIGAGWLPHQMSLHFTIERVIAASMLFTSIIFVLMIIFPSWIFVFILFAGIGLTIAMANTNMTIQVSNVANKTIQGEAMGTQMGLRMLGDTIICLAGGFLIIYSVVFPILLSAIIAFFAFVLFRWKFPD